MNKILLNFPQITITLFWVLSSFSAQGSLSVLTEGNPRYYMMKSGEVLIKKKYQKKIKLRSFDLSFEGADLKRGKIVLDGHSSMKRIIIKKAKIKSEDGTFQCQGIIEEKTKKMDVEFSLKLEPIKNGFKVHLPYKEMDIKAVLKKH